ncbi:uncharacterized protein LOC129608371 [Condylostylus longicornis]|uniref:uncharacterized protein LOC129608371 n=1 Tax=Condylostylus longicornis TaxID=2530218 RepID=UPI00244DD799|nr:uncharacterized protein LOC129608371 [Condylostylus longicornis]
MSELSQNSNDEIITSKETRWDRIRKRHMNSLNVKTETVKKFIEIDYIGKKNMKLLNGDINPNHSINPALVMDLRHEMIERITKPKKELIPEKEYALDKVKAHNQAVEDHYIDNELNKLKTELEKSRIKMSKKLQRPKLTLTLSNKGIFQSLEKCTDVLDDFYCAPIEALQEANKISNDSVEKSNSSDEKFESETKSPVEVSSDLKNNPSVNGYTSPDNHVSSHDKTQILVPEINIKDDVEEVQENRCVRFEDNIEIHNYSREPSFNEGLIRFETEFQNGEIVEGFALVGKSLSINCSDGEIDSRNSKFIEIEEINNFQEEEEIDENCIVEKIQFRNEDIRDDKDYVFTVNDDLLRIRRALPDTNDLQVIVQMNSIDNGSQDISEEIDNKSDSDLSNSEQTNAITKLFRPKCPPTEILMRKYFLRWIHFTTLEKIEKQNFSNNEDDRILKINAFLDQIRREKRKISKINSQRPEFDANGHRVRPSNDNEVVVTKKYQRKIKVQQDIIELQRLKLERQERMIMELKLNKLAEAAKLSQQEIKMELKNVIRNGEQKNRCKAKCLQLVGNLRDEEDEEFAKLQGRSLMDTKFLERMQQRAIERSIKHEQARQRRLQQEAEREAAKIAAEEAKRFEDEEAKKQRIEALKEKRRQEKLARIQKERDRQRFLEISKIALDFARRKLLSRYGIEVFKQIVSKKRNNYRKAEIFRRKNLKRKVFAAWIKFFVEIWENREKKADYMYQTILRRTHFGSWQIYLQNERSKYMVAIDWYDLKITENVFKIWLGVTKLMKIVEETKTKQAESHYQWNLRWKILDRWRRLPQILKLEKETEQRRQRWRMKIWELLPDYTPNRDDE